MSEQTTAAAGSSAVSGNNEEDEEEEKRGPKKREKEERGPVEEKDQPEQKKKKLDSGEPDWRREFMHILRKVVYPQLTLDTRILSSSLAEPPTSARPLADLNTICRVPEHFMSHVIGDGYWSDAPTFDPYIIKSGYWIGEKKRDDAS
jgi:hypothetical protein